MKKRFLKSFCARCLTLLVLALLSTNLAWGETHTWTLPVTSTTNDVKKDNSATNGTGLSVRKTDGNLHGGSWTNRTGKGSHFNVSSSGGYFLIEVPITSKTKSFTLTTDIYAWKSSNYTKKTITIKYCTSTNSTETQIVSSNTETTGCYSYNATTELSDEYAVDDNGTLSIKIYPATGNIGFESLSVTTNEETSTPTDPFTVTFNPGTNGTCSTTSLTETSAGAGITLPECTANDGYVFKGWSTTEGGTTPNAGVADETYKPSSNCTLYAVYAKTYVLTITQPADGGTLTVTDGTNELETGAIIEVGTNLTCEVTNIPKGKRFSRFYAKWGKESGQSKYKQNNPATFENLTKDVLPEDISALEVYVNYQDLEKYTINYMINGVNTGAQENVYEGTPLEFPTVNDFGGKVFVGWSETAINGTTDEKPELVNISGLTATANATYYAVFATKEGEGEDKYVKITSTSDLTDGLYLIVYETGKVALDGALTEDKASNTVSVTISNGEITPTSAINAAAVTFNATNGSFLGGGGKYIGHTGTNNTLNYSESPLENVVTFDNDGNVVITAGEYVMRYNTNADQKRFRYYKSGQQPIQLYLKHGATYSDYCTTITSTNIIISEAGWATVCLPFKATITSGNATAYYVTGTNETALTKEKAEVIPANEGILLKSNDGDATTVTFTISAEDATDATGNMMKGSLTGETFNDTGYKYYILANGGNGLGFYYQGAENDGSTVTCAAGKAILAVPTTSSAKAFFSLDNEPTGIESLTPALSEGKGVYNLNGLKVNEAYKGIVIMNGKKYINK